MADWTAPFQMPRFSTEEFERKKARYNAKYGYTIHIPEFDDIVHLTRENPPTEQEKEWWRKKQWKNFTPERLEELRQIKEKRRRQYQRMLDSPQPEILRARSSIITAIDNVQDALSTLVVLGIVARIVLPRAIAGLLGGPLGWIMTAAAVLDVANGMITGGLGPLTTKRAINATTEKNPFSKKARAKRAKKLAANKIHVGNLIEVAQTTDNIFGVGLCLGPIMGLGGDLISGAIRYAMGQKVHIDNPYDLVERHNRMDQKAFKALHHTRSAMIDQDSDTNTQEMILANLATQQSMTNSQMWNPLDEVEKIDQIETEALKPENPIIREVIKEEGDDPEQHIAWPTTGKRWSRYNDIADSSHDRITQSTRDYCYKNKDSWTGFIGGCNISHAALGMVETLEGEGAASFGYTNASRFVTGLLDKGLKFGPGTTPKQMSLLVNMLEKTDTSTPNMQVKEMLKVAERSFKIKFVDAQ